MKRLVDSIITIPLMYVLYLGIIFLKKKVVREDVFSLEGTKLKKKAYLWISFLDKIYPTLLGWRWTSGVVKKMNNPAWSLDKDPKHLKNIVNLPFFLFQATLFYIHSFLLLECKFYHRNLQKLWWGSVWIQESANCHFQAKKCNKHQSAAIIAW